MVNAVVIFLLGVSLAGYMILGRVLQKEEDVFMGVIVLVFGALNLIVMIILTLEIIFRIWVDF